MAVFTAIGAAIFGAGTFGALATAAVLQVATGIAVSLIGRSLAGEEKTKTRGTRLSMASGADLPRSIMFGYGATAGSLVYANYWGNSDETPNAYLTQVICLTDYPVNSLEQVWVNGELCTLADTPHSQRGYPVIEYRKSGKDHLWIKFYDGTQTTADSFLVDKVAGNGRPYESTRVGKGCAYVIATALVNDKKFSGYPTFLFALNGAKLYDISRDTTAGGFGPHRWDNPATWGGDGDHLPLVQAYNVLRGMTYGGEWFYGLQGLAASRLPAAVWIEQINKCRADTDGPEGTEADYRSGGEILLSDPIAHAIEQMLTACQGRIAEVGGIYKPHVGAPVEDPVFEFTDDHIITAQSQSFTPFFGLAETINGITASYPAPREGWTPKRPAPRLSPEFETEDGNRRLMADVNLDMVPYKGQVQRLMKAALAEARRARRHTFVLPPEALILEPNDIISWTSERNGYEDKLFRVDGVFDRADLDVLVDITEVDPTDYDWDQETDYTEPVDGPVTRVTPAPQAMTGWSVAPYEFVDSVGTARRPGIEVTFAGGLDDVRSVRIQVREDFGDSDIVWDSGAQTYDVTEADPVTRRITWAGILPNTDYEVRGIFLPNSDREAEWSAWLEVTTPDARMNALDVYEGSIVADLPDSIIEWQNWVGDNLRDLIDEMAEVARLAREQDLANYQDVQTLNRRLVSTFDAARAEFDESILAATGPGSAIVLQLTELQAQVGDDIAGAVSGLQTQIGDLDLGLDALAEAFTALTAGTTAGDIASTNFRMSAASGPSGYSRVGAQTRYGGTGSWRGASWFLDTPANAALPTRFVVNAQQFVIVSAGFEAVPFVFEAGEAKMMAARINVIKSGKIQNASGSSYFDLTNNKLRVST